MRRRPLNELLREQRGAMAVETALVAPVLAMMALGTFEVGSLVSRQQELQSAASEAEGIILAAAGASTESELGQIELVIENSLGLGADNVALAPRFRCETGPLVTDGTTCASGEKVYQYVRVQITDTYTPTWTSFGVGSPVNYSIVRTVQVK